MSANIPHPGVRIKAEIIPSGMSVTKAAELIGVGRPALSNLLNGNAALSADMAARLEKAFKYPLKDLMEMQARYDAAQAKQKDAPADTKAYVPPFLAIKANDIEALGLAQHPGAQDRWQFSCARWCTRPAAGSRKWTFPATTMPSAPDGTGS